MFNTRFTSLILCSSALFLLAGCAEFFGTHEGYEDGTFMPGMPGMDVEGTVAFEVVGISPSVATEGAEVGVFMLSAPDAPVSDFVVEDFWFCTFDGEAAMLETGGDSYEPDVDLVDVDESDLEVSDKDLEDSTISVVTFTVPSGSVTGEGLVFTPSDTQYFVLGIQ